jgi:hypothetical protein
MKTKIRTQKTRTKIAFKNIPKNDEVERKSLKMVKNVPN